MRPAASLDLAPAARAALALAATALMLIIAYALLRGALGFAPDLPWARRTAREVAVILHVATAITAIPLGLSVILIRKGGARHRLLGRTWLGLMATTAVCSFFIRHMNQGALGWIHLLSALTLAAVPAVILAARKRRIRLHGFLAITLFTTSLIVAGGFTFVPGRLFGLWAFG